MTSKVSTSTTTPRKTIGQELNYTLDYAYYDAKSHQAERIGDIWYLYDANGNVTEARQGGHSGTTGTGGQVVAQGDVRWTSEGFGLDRGSGQTEDPAWARYYTWDEENRLKRSVEDDLSVEYRYGADGQRAIKYSKRGENLYYDAMWSESISGTSIRQSKHVYVGQTRVATRLNHKYQSDTGYEQANTYYYHPDHLGSAQLVTDPDGQEYEHLEYTPYGELWVEQTRDGIELIPFRFTGKELDSETGLYYYGARYLDPKTSVWLSADPALGEYVPGAPIDDEAKKRNGNLPGMGGVFNTVNLHLYHYAGNNPIKYTDPDGRSISAGRWASRNWDELLGLALSGVEIGLGVVGAAQTLGVSSWMVIHGASNAGATLLKMSITTADALMNGDDSADRLDAALPNSAAGMVSFAAAKITEGILGGSGRFAEAMGALGDMADIAIGIGLGKALSGEVAKGLAKLSAADLNSAMKLVKFTQEDMIAKGMVGLAEKVMTYLTAENAEGKVDAYTSSPW